MVYMDWFTSFWEDQGCKEEWKEEDEAGRGFEAGIEEEDFSYGCYFTGRF